MRVTVLGGINQDVVLHVAALPQPGETLHTTGLTHGPGGKGLNKSVAAARYGSAAALLGAVGDDAAGTDLLAFLRGEGIDVSAVRTIAGTTTGQAHITLAQDGANVILVTAGANAHTMVGDVPPGVLLADLEAPLSAVEALFATPGSVRILNAAPAAEAARPLLAQADLLVVNETELAFYTGSADPQALIAHPDQRVVVTLGGDGCRLVGRGRDLHLPAHAVPVVDTVGAGDCFCGVLAAALAEGQDDEAALRTASAAAARAVGRAGAATAMPTRAEVDALLAR